MLSIYAGILFTLQNGPPLSCHYYSKRNSKLRVSRWQTEWQVGVIRANNSSQCTLWQQLCGIYPQHDISALACSTPALCNNNNIKTNKTKKKTTCLPWLGLSWRDDGCLRHFNIGERVRGKGKNVLRHRGGTMLQREVTTACLCVFALRRGGHVMLCNHSQKQRQRDHIFLRYEFNTTFL